MRSDPDDDDALRWDGDDENGPASLPPGWKAVGKGSDDVPGSPADAASARHDAETADDDTHALGTVSLVLLGVLGGVYLLYTVGWLIGGIRLKQLANLIVADAMYVPWLILAVAAPALWFLTGWVLTRGRAMWLRMLVLLAGVVLLVPWPFVMMGALGS
ncbi:MULTISPECIES: hypothetical protein [Microbacterium]|uniref:hypothetical protein n=1 Tax=Microbacterium TaxID=33882 RepID=UPI00217D408A|nr:MULTISPECIES: hypothetical protein [Microbacterium]